MQAGFQRGLWQRNRKEGERGHGLCGWHTGELPSTRGLCHKHFDNIFFSVPFSPPAFSNFLCVLERKMTTRALHFLVLVVF